MKRSWLAAAMLVGVLLGVPGWAGNLLPDPGFEGGKWELTAWDHGKGRHELATPGRTGDKCVHLVGIEAKPAAINELAIGPVIPITAGAEYMVSVWYKTTPDVVPSLSFLTYTAPFATSGWKTARAQYDTQVLPPAPQWRLGCWRVRAAPRTVEMRLLLRLGAVGEVWFDDITLVSLADYGLTGLTAGDLSAFPDQRRYEAGVKVPAGEAWVLAVQGPDGTELGRATGQGPQPRVAVAFRAAEGAPCRAELRQAEAVVGFQEFIAPALAELVVDTCRYRGKVYASAMPDVIRGELRFHLTPELRAGLMYRVELRSAAVHAMGSQWSPSTAAGEVLALEAGKLTPGPWQVAAEVRVLAETRKLSHPLEVLPPGKAREVIIDDNSRLLVDGRPFFPNGFYGAPDNDEQTRPIAEAGYNMILTYATDPTGCRKWLDMCQRLGLMGMVSVPTPFVAKFDEARLRAALQVVKDHPALLGYYLFDEPSPSQPNQRPEDLKRVYDIIAGEDPYHPVGVCICSASVEALYLAAYDVVMIDVYPVTPTPAPLTEVADRMDHAWAATGGRKPVWNIPQAFGWDVIEGMDRKTWLTPTPAQARVMYYLALTHNARALVAYCYHVYTRYDAEARKAGKWPYTLGGYLPTKQATLWGELAKLGREVQALASALNQPKQETRVLAEGKLHVGWFYGAGEAWVVAVNSDERETLGGELSLPAGLPNPTRVTDQGLGGKVELVGTRVRLTVPPMTAAAAAVALQ